MSDDLELVPDDFDLDSIRYSTSSTSEEDRKRCPKCKSVNIERRKTDGYHGTPAETKWVCRQGCGLSFDEPITGVSSE